MGKHEFTFKVQASIALFLIIILTACHGEQKKQSQKETKPAPKEEKKQTPLFTLVDGETSGFEFKNYLPENEGNNILTYEYLINGGGAAVGDLNNDGLPEILMTSNLNGVRVFLNRGDLKFKDISESTGLWYHTPFNTGISLVDINEDGYLDVYICRSLANDPWVRANYLFINNQDLTFTEQAEKYGLADPGFSNHASFFDYDNDGDLDMYLLNHRSDFRSAVNLKPLVDYKGEKVRYSKEEIEFVSDRLYRNNGDGSFTEVSEQAGIINKAFGLSAFVADLNQDGWQDVFVANDYSDKDFLYINNHDGTFTDRFDEFFFHTSKHSMGSNIADFNNDGLLDVITLDMLPPDNYRLKKFKWQASYDLYHKMVAACSYHQVMRNNLQLNNGNGTFSEISQLAGISHSDWSWTPLFEDFDNDGHKDLYITNGYFHEGHDMDFMKYESNKIMEKAGGVDKVKNMELIKQMPSTKISNFFYKNNGDLTFSDRTAVSGLNHPNFSNGAVYADLDLDGDLEIVVNNFNLKSFLYKNNSRESKEKSNYLAVQLRGTAKNKFGLGAKVWIYYDGKQQMKFSNPYRGYFSSNHHLLHFGLGGYSGKISLKVEWPGGLVQKMDDLEVNQRITLKVDEAKKQKNEEQKNSKSQPNPLLATINNHKLSNAYHHKEDDFIDFKREPLLEHMISNKGPFLSRADVNADGLEDVYLSGGANQPGKLFLQTSGGKYAEKSISAFRKDSEYEDMQSVFFDVDGDNDMDLYVVSGGYAHEVGSPLYQDRLYLNDGRGNFTRAEDYLPESFENATAVVANDFDQDGDIDLFVPGGALPVAYPLAAKSQLLLNENGKFKNASDWLPKKGKFGVVNDAVYHDFDGDGSSELILAGEWMPIIALKKQGNQFVEVSKKMGLEETGGWWNTIEVADINQDGHQDLLIGNRGLNSFYRASKNQPGILYVADFDENGSIESVPFYYYSNGVSYPKHTMDELFAQYPTIRRRFSRYEKYAHAKAIDIFTQEELGRAGKKHVHTFASSYFENNGQGAFEIKELPLQAQFSEVHGIVAKDINQDGNLDLLVSGNNYGTDVEQGRNDASIGCLLLGDGKGNFKPLGPLESGFEVIGDSRGTYTLNSTTDEPLFMVLRNSHSPKLFKLSSNNLP